MKEGGSEGGGGGHCKYGGGRQKSLFHCFLIEKSQNLHNQGTTVVINNYYCQQ